MEFPFDVAARLGAVGRQEGPFAGRLDRAVLSEPDGAQLRDLAAELHRRSAKARGVKPCDENDHLLVLPGLGDCQDTIVLLAEGRDVLAFARTGVREISVLPPDPPGGDQPSAGYPAAAPSGPQGYAAWNSRLKKISPTCLLDLYVSEGLRGRGLGERVLRAALEQASLAAVAVAYYDPSAALRGMLEGRFGLSGGRLSSTKFLLFDGYFQEHPAVAPALASRSTPAAGPAGSEAEPGAPGDEPAVEEVAEMATLEAGSDPLAVYKKEEGEIFVERTKLFCFNAGEWQDAGAGEVHLLRRAEGRVRLLFQQEATKRIIANHFLVNKDGFCELQRHAGNDKAWVWTAQERVIERMFALRFKTVEQAAKFKDVFEEAKRSSPDARGDDYVVIRKVGVTVAPDVRSQHVRLLSVGETVRVGEVVYSATDQRVRGRLTRPAGWITIMSHNVADAASYAVRSCDLDDYTAKSRGGSPVD